MTPRVSHRVQPLPAPSSSAISTFHISSYVAALKTPPPKNLHFATIGPPFVNPSLAAAFQTCATLDPCTHANSLCSFLRKLDILGFVPRQKRTGLLCRTLLPFFVCFSLSFSL